MREGGIRRWAIVAAVLVSAGCGRRGEPPAACVPGAVVTCPCAGAPVGSQTCQSNGTFGACACPVAAPALPIDPDKPPPVTAPPEAPEAPIAASPPMVRPRSTQPAVVAQRPVPPAAPAPVDPNIPEMPTRSDVASAMRSVAPLVRACGTGSGGTATVTVVFVSDGHVATANVADPFAGTPVGSCIARAVRGARVPPFSRPTFSVTFPFPID